MWSKQLRNLSEVVEKNKFSPAEIGQITELGNKLIREKKGSIGVMEVGIILLASEYAFFENEVETICIKPLNLTSKKTNLQLILERIKHLYLKGVVYHSNRQPRNNQSSARHSSHWKKLLTFQSTS